MSNRKKALLFLVILMLVIVVIAIAEMLKLLVNVGMIAQSIEFGRESYEAVETTFGLYQSHSKGSLALCLPACGQLHRSHNFFQLL